MDNVVQTNISQPEKNQQQGNLKKLLLGVGFGLGFLFLSLLTLNYFHVISLKFSGMPFQNLVQNNLGSHILTVGKETLYQQDLDAELSYYPPQKNIDRQKLLMQKLTKDSITLQAAAADGLITLDVSVFNSPNKDYTKRLQLVSDVQKTINTRRDTISGEVIAIWFNNGKPGLMGYDAGKALARSKITKLQADVAGKKITIEQAAQQIQNDISLQKVDPAYKSNALFTFAVGPEEKIVFDPAFNEILKKLQVGQVSAVYLAKDKERVKGIPTEKMIDAVYMFAHLSQRKVSDNPGFDAWYAQKASAYESTNK